MCVKFKAFPERIEFHGPGLRLALSETSIHHYLTAADKSRPKGYFLDLFPRGRFGLLVNFLRPHSTIKILHLYPALKVIFGSAHCSIDIIATHGY